MIFLAGSNRDPQRRLHRAVHERLAKQPGCKHVRYRASSIRPRYVVTDVVQTTFLGRMSDIGDARLEIRFWLSRAGEDWYYRINWIEPERGLLVGFHRDDDHPSLGDCHVQLEADTSTIERLAAPALDGHPLAILDTRLQQLPSLLEAVERDPPRLSSWP